MSLYNDCLFGYVLLLLKNPFTNKIFSFLGYILHTLMTHQLWLCMNELVFTFNKNKN